MTPPARTPAASTSGAAELGPRGRWLLRIVTGAAAAAAGVAAVILVSAVVGATLGGAAGWVAWVAWVGLVAGALGAGTVTVWAWTGERFSKADDRLLLVAILGCIAAAALFGVASGVVSL